MVAGTFNLTPREAETGRFQISGQSKLCSETQSQINIRYLFSLSLSSPFSPSLKHTHTCSGFLFVCVSVCCVYCVETRGQLQVSFFKRNSPYFVSTGSFMMSWGPSWLLCDPHGSVCLYLPCVRVPSVQYHTEFLYGCGEQSYVGPHALCSKRFTDRAISSASSSSSLYSPRAELPLLFWDGLLSA